MALGGRAAEALVFNRITTGEVLVISNRGMDPSPLLTTLIWGTNCVKTRLQLIRNIYH